ncbi:bifunctional ADP-dependent NAD(P)H-hydrate dehydratase/NAD(P)H-hydrate epimerase [Fibrobacter sp. UWB11]|uniref:bifunctional ADP-dependent NAD(P)H-hydrate dehydratase/NAD(P)H-hydrate epimerase n=1 Tax=Fibrobacter sp. UWB11 TaxID=1896202 RepID=UPI00092ABC54|nr:bifunctional ADP-dependent NAD(P)H-hydrate dehydratase/NAD(P)H-hydrate epimerase [Fibrobacter sp. UWB11]SIO26726.1 NAD(P)H-hydrate epimerase [Fibrobacter sp. UWB11]
MYSLQSLNLQPILSTDGMRGLDTASKNFLANENTSEPSEKDVIQSGYTLMQEAGLALFKFVQEKALEPIAIFIGGGNNGGDGLVLAKHLLQAGIKSTVFSLANEIKFKNEAKLALDDFQQAGGSLFDFKKIIEDPKQASLLLHEGFKLIVDCMLGNGAKGELRQEFASTVQAINNSGLPVIAADAPTGYDSNAHICNDICIHADETMLFGFPRLDAYTKEGGPSFGKVVIAPLNYPAEPVQQFDERVYLITESAIPQLTPKRDEWGDKRIQGSPLIIAGSKGMPGAAALCTEAALRSGAGLVTLAVPQSIAQVLQTKLSEPVFCRLEDKAGENCRDEAHSENRGVLQPEHIPTLLKRAKHASATAIGPGLSTNAGAVQAVLDLLPQLSAPTVIDADALNAIATLNEGAINTASQDCAATNNCAAVQYLREMKAPAILTPHIREFARLFGKLPENSCEIPSRLREIATSINKVILLKGAPTFIAAPDANVYIIPVANSGMAKGGSGDVLTGIIVALISQGLAVTEAAVLGALLHQKAGRITREELGAFSMLPSDVIKNLHKAF